MTLGLRRSVVDSKYNISLRKKESWPSSCCMNADFYNSYVIDTNITIIVLSICGHMVFYGTY